MTTVIADIINSSTLGNPVNIRNLVQSYKSLSSVTIRTVTYNSSANNTNTQTTLLFQGGTVIFGISLNPQGIINFAETGIDNNFSNMAMLGDVLLNKLQIDNLQSFLKIINPIFPINTSTVKFDSTFQGSTTNLQLNTPDNTPINVTFPSTSGQLLGLNSNIFIPEQIFTNGIKTDNVQSLGANNSITLSGNGTGSVVCIGTQQQNSITAKSANAPLSLTGNGTGLTIFDANGIQFLDGGSVLQNYSIGSFSTIFTCGTFNSGIQTIQFERIGRRVILRVPAVAGTPNVDQPWLATLPVDLISTVTQNVAAGVGIKNGTTQNTKFVKLNANSASWSVAFGNDTSGFGTAGSCGWSSSWSVSYLIN